MRCRRCGQPTAHPSAAGYCPYCAARAPQLHWVAEPPPSTQRPLAAPRRARYTGPPRYPAPPRWGFPALPWPSTRDPERSGPDVSVQLLGGTLAPLLWATAAVALVAAGGEAWRYGLLLESRDGALSAGMVAASDALVSSAGWIAPLLGLLAGLFVVPWTLSAMRAAAAVAGVRPARSARSVVLGWLVPGPNLSVPGSVLAEIEHAALRRPPGARPRPSRLLVTWWALWAGSVLFAAVVALWALRAGVQAQADGVVLHALLDALAAATASVTALLVARFTRLLGPVRATAREVVAAVHPPPQQGSGTRATDGGPVDLTPSRPAAATFA